VPAVYALDEKEGWLMVEWVEGEVCRVRVNEFLGLRKDQELSARDEGGEREGEVVGENAALADLMRRMGSAVGKMHAAGIVHGDLTTSNLMLRPPPSADTASENQALDGEIVLIDFGLASQSTQDEDRAVDLYVLERAFGSTHPRAEGLFKELLDAYGKSYKGGNIALKKLEDVRMRGRKRSMLG
jgi:TP53 regulating kinase-like protein